MPRTAQPPYNNGQNSTRKEPDGLGMTPLIAMLDPEPYGAGDVGVDPLDDDDGLPSLGSTSCTEDDYPDDPDDRDGTGGAPKRRKKKKKGNEKGKKCH